MTSRREFRHVLFSYAPMKNIKANDLLISKDEHGMEQIALVINSIPMMPFIKKRRAFREWKLLIIPDQRITVLNEDQIGYLYQKL